MDQKVARQFLKVTGLRLRQLSRERVLRVWRSKGEVYRHALMKVRESDPWAVASAMIYGSFPQAVLHFFETATDAFHMTGSDTDNEKQALRRDFDLRPDLFALDPARKEIRLHEIEDTHPIKPLKLSKIMKAYGWCDDAHVNLRLFVYDRYGLSRREPDLSFLAFTDYGDDLFVCSMPGVRQNVHEILGSTTRMQPITANRTVIRCVSHCRSGGR
jgi:hypothetical protein